MTAQTLCTGDPMLVPTGLRGYRTWKLDDLHGLRSTYLPYVWNVPTVQAICLRPGAHLAKPHAAPDVGCVCGLYGWYRPDDTRMTVAEVFCAVEASGRVLMGTHGFRAEQARIVAVVLTPQAMLRRGAPRLAGLLRATGVQVFADQDELLDRFPPDDVSGLVDHRCDETCAAVIDSMLGHFGAATVQLHADMSRFATAATSAAAAAVVLQLRARTRHARPPAWKRYTARAGAAALTTLATANTADYTAQAVAGNDRVVSTALAAVNLLFAVQWLRLLRRAWRWGR